jgi:hypothetical protein
MLRNSRQSIIDGLGDRIDGNVSNTPSCHSTGTTVMASTFGEL